MKSFFKTIIVSILTLEARLVLQKYKPTIIAVTGSVGKTSTKDAIYAVLASAFFVRKSEKSFNSEIGIPLTILGIGNGWNNPLIWIKNIIEGVMLLVLKNHYPKWLVLEVGADRPNDITRIAQWLTPHTVVMTRIPEVPVHVEFFDSPEALAKEKSALIKALPPEGTLILNADDEHSKEFRALARGEVRSYGIIAASDIGASHEQILYSAGFPSGISFRVTDGKNSIPITLSGMLGFQHIYPVLAALLVGSREGLNMVSMAQALEKYKAPPGRMRLIQGIKETMIIDDSYNSSPAALQEALKTLERLEVRGKKIAVLGDMMELGSFSADEHKRGGKQAARIVDILLTVGVRARAIAEGALVADMHESKIFQYEDSRRAGKELEHVLTQGDVVLIKGSQAVRCERAVEEIMAHPEDKEKLLVRQDREWLEKIF